MTIILTRDSQDWNERIREKECPAIISNDAKYHLHARFPTMREIGKLEENKWK